MENCHILVQIQNIAFPNLLKHLLNVMAKRFYYILERRSKRRRLDEEEEEEKEKETPMSKGKGMQEKCGFFFVLTPKEIWSAVHIIPPASASRNFFIIFIFFALCYFHLVRSIIHINFPITLI